jgi:hypothetical protein
MIPDEIDRLLTPSSAPPDPALRDRLRAVTTRRLRRSRHLRRLVVATALAVCYVAGVATVWFTRPTPRLQETAVIEASHDNATRPPVLAPQSPRELELAAELADGPERARLYMDAARVFAQSTNWDAAVRCYRNALDAGGGDLTIDPKNDDWLMVTLKLARKEEQSHANVDE